jgi:hypothetical protein
VGGPFYLPNAPSFAPNLLESVVFHVVSNTGGPVPFNFCISNMTLLTNSPRRVDRPERVRGTRATRSATGETSARPSK